MKPHRIIYLTAIVTLLFTFQFSLLVRAQFGNEWINYQQSYFRIPVLQKGLYRISTDDLRKAGVPVNAVNPVAVQLFFRGQEQAIFISGEADQRFDDQDFIDFYGEGNDGTQDSLLYIPNSAQPHKIYNLYSDTTAYFLTWRLDGKAGKRMETYSELPRQQNVAYETYHNESLLVSNIASQNYAGMSEGLIYPEGLSEGTLMAYYDVGEGWTGSELEINKLTTKEITLENTNANGPKPMLEVHLMGRDHHHHKVELMVGNSPNLQRTIETATFYNFYPYLSKKEIGFQDIAANGKLYVSTISRGQSSNQTDDAYSVTYFKVNYPQFFRFTNQTQKLYNLNPNPADISYIRIPAVPTNAQLYDLTDKNTPIRINYLIDNNGLTVGIRNTKTAKSLFLTTAPLSVLGVNKVAFRNIDPTKHNYLIVTHKALITNAKRYADYRASVAGGQYDTLTVDMDLLVNQFNYGEFSPLAIRRFAQFMADRGNPKFMFIIGKTQQVNLNRTAPDRYLRDLVPTFGFPGSDNLFSHGLKGFPQLVPAIPTGRLWTDSPQTVLDYLDKVKEFEVTPMNALWRKNILHLSGGISVGEQKLFKSFMDDFKNKAKRQYLGAKITTITKKTDDAVEYVGLANEVNDGAGMITLFGHSSLSVTDIDIGFVSNDVLGYRNRGRYPLIYANGCVLGNFTFGAKTYPMDWVGTKNRGAVLFLAHSNLAYSFSIKQYGDILYETMFNDSTNLSKPFGEIQQKTIQRYLKENPDSPIHKADAQEFSLQGDPAIVIFPAKKPDYSLVNKNINIQARNGQVVSGLTDSLKVLVVVSNFGLFQKNNLKIRLTRTLKDGSALVYQQIFGAVAYQDTLQFVIPNDRNQSGLNRFEIALDPDNAIAEINENNNVATFDFNIPTLGAYPLLPAEYTIVQTVENNQPIVTLIAQSVDNQSRSYAFEIDTVAAFSSTYRQTQNVTSTFLPTWNLNLLNRDSTVYYWRVRYADRPASTENGWSESSFTFIKNSTEGWTQRQPAQFSKAIPLQISLSQSTQPTWTFQNVNVPITASVNGNSVGGFAQGYLRNSLSISDILMVGQGNCGNSNIIITTLKRDNLRAYSVLPTYNCGNPPYAINALPDAEIIGSGLLDKYLNAVPDGDYVLLMTAGNIQFDRWPTATKAKLSAIGVSAERLAEMRSGRPYLFIGQKGAKTLVKELLTDPEELAPSLKTVLLDNYNLKSTFGNGQIISSLIGPASAWNELKYKIGQSVNQSKLDIIGVNLNNQETVLLTNQLANQFNLSQIDAVKFPFLKLVLKLNNPSVNDQLPAQLKNWLITYTPVAEGSANANLLGGFEKQEGENFTVNVSFKNLSKYAFRDSVLAQGTLYLPNGQIVKNNFKLGKLQSNQEATFNLPVQTLGRAGDNRLVVNFNPRLQPEQTYSNNVVNLPFTVVPDRTPPTMDVTFDDQQIRNGDIVSANPTILIALRDENRFLFKQDTTAIDLFLQQSNQALKRISLKNSSIKITPANAQNLYLIEYKPGLLPDGVYTLRVQGADASNNRTGVYSISFTVVNESMVQTFKVFPNPSSDVLHFEFGISGSTAPDEAQIVLTDLTGRTVATFSRRPRVGTNDWLWPDSSALANGEYIYRLTVRKNGQDLPLSNGMKASGKVVLVR
jgi:Peptidase family C25